MSKKPSIERGDDQSRQAIAHDLKAVEAAVNVIGGKWKIMILLHLHVGMCRFSELCRLMPLITPQSLTVQLRDLERDGIVHREIFAQVPPRVEYSLTDLGTNISPMMAPLMTWGYAILEQQAQA